MPFLMVTAKISGFGSTVQCSDFGKSGKLIAVGQERGILSICTTDKNKSICATSFFLGGQKVATLGCDAVVNIWDIAIGDKISSYSVSADKEVGRAMITGRSNENLLCFGDFQGNVVMQDIRQSSPVCKLNMSNAIASLAFNSSDNKLAIATGSIVQSWDFASQKFLYDDENANNKLLLHYKLITSMHITNHPNRNESSELLVSASLDKLVKFTKLDDGKELHQFKSTFPITALGVTTNCETVIYGGEKGFLKSRLYSENLEDLNKKKLSENVDCETENLLSHFSTSQKNVHNNMSTEAWLQEPRVGSRRGPKDWLSVAKSPYDAKICLPLIHENTEISRYGRTFYANSMIDQFTRVDHLLRKFSHSRALTVALNPRFWLLKKNRKGSKKVNNRTQLHVTLGVIRELVRRDTLAVALAGRSAVQLERVFKFINRNFWSKEATTTCLQLYHCLLDVYSCEELAGIREFSKTNRLLQLSSSNIHGLRNIRDLIEHNPVTSSRTGL